MSAKWRALQHRHRYTYSAVVFPRSYVEALEQLQSYESCFKLYTKLNELISLNSIYAQVNQVKEVASAFGDLLLHGDGPLASVSAYLYLELLFFENSLPLHRTLVSVLAKSRTFHSEIGECFRKLCNKYGGGIGNGERFCVSRVALSVLGMPKLGYLVQVVEDCAVLVAWDIVFSLSCVVLETNERARPSPIVMEQCQEALSCLYYLLQRFPAKLKNSICSEGGFVPEESSMLQSSLRVILSILKSPAFSRDCFVAAGVGFFAALQVYLSPEALGFFIMEGIFKNKICYSDVKCDSKFKNEIAEIPYKEDICSEICILSVLSRLCLIRGILTAVSRSVLNTHFTISSENVNGCEVKLNYANPIKTILYDEILPELCSYCENPIDGHFNFHALTVMQICLQQIKTSLLSNLSESVNYEPIPEEMGTRILRIIWNNLEDPLSQTVKQVHLIFDLFLDIQSFLFGPEGGEKIKLFLWKIGTDLLCLGPRCKGRYVPLALLTKRLGAKTMLIMNSDLLFQTTEAYIDDDVCCAATSFLKCFLEYLRDECWSSDGVEGGYALYRGYCLPPILYGLASGISKLRSNLNTYALPVLLEIDVDSIFPMLAFISVGPNGDDKESTFPNLKCTDLKLSVEQQVAILISLLKVSRSLALIEGDIDWCGSPAAYKQESGIRIESSDHHALICIKGIKVEILVAWLIMALIHVDESLRVDAAESLFLNPKTSSLPSHLELFLMKEAVPLNMRCCSTAFQMKLTSLFRKFFSRVRTALERQCKQGSWQPLGSCKSNEVRGDNVEILVKRADDLFHFMRWLSCFLFFSCYPSAPYKRKVMAMELILIMMNVWSIVPPLQEGFDSTPENSLCIYSKGITSPNSTLLLVGSIIDSWDRLRESSFHILLHFPTPLPGISSEDMVLKVIVWAKKLVCSPRVRESDAGALTLRLLFRKYVVELGWLVNASVDAACHCTKSALVNEVNQHNESGHPVIDYIRSIIDWLDDAVGEGERNLSAACKNSFVHGILLALRYTFEELDWNSDIVLSRTTEIRCLLEKLLELVMRITSLALWVVSADAWYLPEDMDRMVDDDNILIEIPDEVDMSLPSSELGGKTGKSFLDGRSSEQIVMVGCWLAMKEVSLLLGTIIRKIPLSSGTNSDLLESGATLTDATDVSSLALLDLKQLETIGNHFLEVLLKMKHNGAIDKTRAGFTALCNRLLCSNDPSLCKLTESWLEQLMERTVAKGQLVDDLLRRSAGIPAAFIALFLSEPEGTPKKLLPRALRWLIDLANGSLLDENGKENANGYPCEATKFTEEPRRTVSDEVSKVRDEGVIPMVHTFNVLRAAFNDTNLATDTSGFSAEALIVSIRSFSSPYWEIRNSACLAYTALVRRMVGFLNVHKQESARRALTGLEFFHRYPSLHMFLFNELKVATEFLASPGNPESSLVNNLHPSLCPVLILLSRLKPSSIASETGDELDPFLFMPFIRQCSTQSNLRIRVLASRALSGLVSNEKLPNALLNIASELPCAENVDAEAPSSFISCRNPVTYNSIHGTLLQLSSLLDTNCRNLADFSKKDQILLDLVQVLLPRSWISSPGLCPCPILNTSFLRVLDQMLSVVRICQMSKSFLAVRNLLLELSTECLDYDASYGLSYHDPTIAELREQAAVSYFNCAYQTSEDLEEVIHVPLRPSLPSPELFQKPDTKDAFSGLLDRLICCLSDSSYEVRLATLKWLLKFLKAIKSGGMANDTSISEISLIHLWTNTNIHPTLIKLLDSEDNHRCTNYLLRVLFFWNKLQFDKFSEDMCSEAIFVGRLDCDSVFHFWDKLIFLYKLTRHAKTREILLCCMGVCVRRFAILYASSVHDEGRQKFADLGECDQLEVLARLHDCIVFFTGLIKQHSASSEPTSMRMAAAESLIASGLLEQAWHVGSSVHFNITPNNTSLSHSEHSKVVDSYAYQILDSWFTCIKLLEDEDDGIRMSLSSDIQKYFSLEKSGSSSIAGFVPIQVDKVIRFSFDHLSSIFGHWIEYFNYLARWVLIAASYVSSTGDLVRRVFDKEIDNHYEEKLLVSQICCSHLEKLPVSKSWPVDMCNIKGFRNHLLNWRTRFFHQLVSFAKDHAAKLGGIEWIGGMGNHKDAFLPLYANLLGFYAVSNCIFYSSCKDAMPLLSRVVELGRTIRPFLGNPLIGNLYLLVLKSHEKYVGEVVNEAIPELGYKSSWEEFDPYFLLR